MFIIHIIFSVIKYLLCICHYSKWHKIQLICPYELTQKMLSKEGKQVILFSNVSLFVFSSSLSFLLSFFISNISCLLGDCSLKSYRQYMLPCSRFPLLCHVLCGFQCSFIPLQLCYSTRINLRNYNCFHRHLKVPNMKTNSKREEERLRKKEKPTAK